MSGIWKKLRPAWLLTLLIIIGWVVALVGHLVIVCPPSIPASCQKATAYLAQNNALVVYAHQYYQVFTSIFVTDSSLDAWFNALAVLIIDRITEDSLNKTRYFIVFFLTAILGNLVSLFQGPYFATAGASGGIFGIFAALVIFSSLKDKKINLPGLVLFLIIFVMSSIVSDVNYVAHIGGAIGGFVAGAVLYEVVKPTITEYSTAYNSAPKTIIATVILVLLVSVFSTAQFLLFAGA